MTQAESKAKIEEITDDVPAGTTEVQQAEDEDDDDEAIQTGSGVTVHNRNEKKARKLIEKLNLKKVDGISRVFFKKAKGIVFTIDNPDVYKNPSTGTYVVFGEAKMNNQSGDMAQKLAALQQQGGQGGDAAAAAAAAAQQQSAGEAAKDPTADLGAAVANTSIKDDAAEEDENVDATGLSEDDIKLIMEQANASRGKAVAALKKNNSDVVNSIMELTT